jgi:toxin ParE1/3/4
MSVLIERSDFFKADFELQFMWYLENADERVAWQFQDALNRPLMKLAGHPDLGRRRKFRHPLLRSVRSFRVAPPFDRLLIFYRPEPNVLQILRLMHAARDLPRRMLENPSAL